MGCTTDIARTCSWLQDMMNATKGGAKVVLPTALRDSAGGNGSWIETPRGHVIMNTLVRAVRKFGRGGETQDVAHDVLVNWDLELPLALEGDESLTSSQVDFLYATVRNQTVSDHRKATAEKRGGRVVVESIDRSWREEEESVVSTEPVCNDTFEERFLYRQVLQAIGHIATRIDERFWKVFLSIPTHGTAKAALAAHGFTRPGDEEKFRRFLEKLTNSAQVKKLNPWV